MMQTPSKTVLAVTMQSIPARQTHHAKLPYRANAAKITPKVDGTGQLPLSRKKRKVKKRRDPPKISQDGAKGSNANVNVHVDAEKRDATSKERRLQLLT
jgi:hypothetical protein